MCLTLISRRLSISSNPLPTLSHRLAEVFLDVVSAAERIEKRDGVVAEVRPVDAALDLLVVVELADLPEVHVAVRLAYDLKRLLRDNHRLHAHPCVDAHFVRFAEDVQARLDS